MAHAALLTGSWDYRLVAIFIIIAILSAHAALLTGSWDYRLVAISIIIAILAAYAALDLAGRVTATQGVARAACLGGGAIALGLGIWSMHYVGMEALRLPVTVLYDWPTVLAS